MRTQLQLIGSLKMTSEVRVEHRKYAWSNTKLEQDHKLLQRMCSCFRCSATLSRNWE